METVVFWIILSFVIGYIADKRGRSGIGWLALSLAISPVITLILLVLLPSHAPKTPATTTVSANRKTKRCPLCAEDIMIEAMRCKHCGADLIASGENKDHVAVPSTSENDLDRYGIRYENGKFAYQDYRYDKAEDALAYARLKEANRD